MDEAGQVARDALAVVQPGFDGTRPPDWVRRLIAQGLGGVCLFARNTPDPGTTARLSAALRAENPAVVVAADEEGGAVTRVESAHGSRWPGNAALGRAGDPALTRAAAAEMGAFLASAGITLAYAPTADVTSDPRNPVIGVRSFGTSAADVAAHTAAFVTGLQSAGVAACAKHFPGHGDTSVDSHHGLPVLTIEQDTLDERELVPFRAAVAAGVRTVMAGHLLVPCLDPSRPASLSPAAIGGLLRERLGFDGAVVTDALEMDAVAARAPLPELAVQALAAGADVLCLGSRRTGEEAVLAVRDALTAAVRDGTLARTRLAEAAGRVRGLTAASGDTGGPVGTAAGPGAGPAPGTAAGQRAAELALDLRGHVPAWEPQRPPVIVTFDPAPTVAVGHRTPWGIAGLLADRLPGTRAHTLGPDGVADGLGPALAAASAREHGSGGPAGPGRPLVLVVRDASRHAWIGDALARALRSRPDAGVVEMGLPGPHRPGAWHLSTYGPSLASARAAVALLCGEGRA